MRFLVLWWCLGALLVTCYTPYDDFHYPSEERTEMTHVVYPTVTSITATSAVISYNGQKYTVHSGSVVGPWYIVAILGAPTNYVVAEQLFRRWGLFVYLSTSGSPITLRKAVGELSGIVQPRFNFTGTDPHYFQKASTDPTDYPSQIALNHTIDGEMDYEHAAAVLAPQRDLVSIGNAFDVVKFTVSFLGRIKCSTVGITEWNNAWQPLANKQEVIFDPGHHLTYWPERFENSKTGLVGGYLRVANVGGFSASVGKGFEVVALGELDTATRSHRDSTTDTPACNFSAVHEDTYLVGCSAGCRHYSTLAEAEAGCSAEATCNGITLSKGTYQLRAGNTPTKSPYNESSWVLLNPGDCHVLPRIPGMNYHPHVLVRLREQVTTTGFGTVRYFRVSNSTQEVSRPSAFYEGLLKYRNKWSTTFGSAMEVTLPYSERRQQDMAWSAMLAGLENYVGNQPNYGNGMTYWSYAREDNGSLPLNILGVDTSLLEWGVCGVGRDHLGFYFDNYVRDDGTVDYYTWGALGDSVADYGRLIDLFIKAVTHCPEDSAWLNRHLPRVLGIGRQILKLRQEAAKAPAPPGCKGLLKGAPEHDWSSVKDLYFFNNNVWTWRGLQTLSDFLSTRKLEPTLASELRAEASSFWIDLQASIAAVTVRKSGSVVFFPPYAKVGFTPFQHMTESRTASYSNFRFYPEVLLARALPGDVETNMLMYHNQRGGRLGGTSRWSTHLDDMPTTGWGYGALINNRTSDFLTLLYGHMANYQSRGSFHGTEQLSYLGEGMYRDFLWWPNNNTLNPHENKLGYYRQENDVSGCVVSQALVAKFTKWQLVLDEPFLPLVALARGAPKRWYTTTAGGFGVKRAPTRFGLVSYTVTTPSTGTAVFRVETEGVTGAVVWQLRWPGGLTSVTVTHGTVLEEDKSGGAVAVRADSTVGYFEVKGVFVV